VGEHPEAAEVDEPEAEQRRMRTMATSWCWGFVPCLHVSARHGVHALFRMPSLLAVKHSPMLQAVFQFKQDVADGDATGEAAALALALAAAYKRVRAHVRVASLSRTDSELTRSRCRSL
jgi:hypothetical protein